jgi:hypothetical protein
MITKIMDFLSEYGGQILVIGIVIAFLIVPAVLTTMGERGITAEQAEQINIWLYEQPEVEEAIDKARKDGRINQTEYKQIEDAYKAAVAAEKIPRILR